MKYLTQLLLKLYHKKVSLTSSLFVILPLWLALLSHYIPTISNLPLLFHLNAFYTAKCNYQYKHYAKNLLDSQAIMKSNSAIE